MMKLLNYLIILLIVFAPTIKAADADDVNQLSTYTVVLGRGIACHLDTHSASRRLGQWFDRTFPPGTADHKTYMIVMIEGLKMSAEAQANGQSPDSCDVIREQFPAFPWP